jgi:ppGpp synthetase/RelA/SpoT-type nucleotidyltranferase
MPLNKENISKEYEQHKDNFKTIVKEIEESLKRAAQKYYSATRFSVHIPPLRIKTIPSILGKLERKNREEESLFKKDGEVMRLVTNDFIGGRILCNTQEDVDEVRKILATYPRFVVEKFEDIRKGNGYTALHLDILYETFWNDDKIYIPLEIQIKTHFQHAWAEITHDDDYKPDSNIDIDTSLKEYYKQIAHILGGLDGFLITIRKQKLAFVTPPNQLNAADTIINSKTLSFSISKYRRGEQVTNQEMNILLRRLKDENFETIEDIQQIFESKEVESLIKTSKEELSINDNVSSFELLKYGSLIHRNKIEMFKEEIKSDLGFVKEQCQICAKNLTKEELEFIKTQTDSDIEFFCEEHRDEKYPFTCMICGKRSSHDICINCAAEDEASKI